MNLCMRVLEERRTNERDFLKEIYFKLFSVLRLYVKLYMSVSSAKKSKMRFIQVFSFKFKFCDMLRINVKLCRSLERTKD